MKISKHQSRIQIIYASLSEQNICLSSLPAMQAVISFFFWNKSAASTNVLFWHTCDFYIQLFFFLQTIKKHSGLTSATSTPHATVRNGRHLSFFWFVHLFCATCQSIINPNQSWVLRSVTPEDSRIKCFNIKRGAA